jgi:hypothetical protein
MPFARGLFDGLGDGPARLARWIVRVTHEPCLTAGWAEH